MLLVAIVAVVVFVTLALLALIRFTRASSAELTDNLRRAEAKAAIEEPRGSAGAQQLGLGGGYTQ